MRRASWLAAILFSIPCHAQSPRELGLSLRDCRSGASEVSGELLELLRLELQADGVARVTTQASDLPARETALWIERGCERVEGQLLLGYRDPRRDRRLERSLSLEDVPVALRERTLALALAELFRAGEANASPEPGEQERTAAVAAVSGTADRSVERAAIDATDQSAPTAADGGSADLAQPRAYEHVGPRPTWGLSLGPALQILPGSGTLLIGAELAVGWRNLSAGVLGNLGHDADPLGTVGYRRLQGFLAYDALWIEPAPFRVAAGLRAAFGATFANVTPTTAAVSRNVSAASGDLALETSLSWLLGSGWQTKLKLDLGYAFGPAIRTDERTLADFSGLFIGTSIAVVAALATER